MIFVTHSFRNLIDFLYKILENDLILIFKAFFFSLKLCSGNSEKQNTLQ